MSTFQLNAREIKSFKLLNQLKIMQSFFDNPHSNGIFINYDPLDQNEQIVLREELAKNNLKMIKFSKNISKLLFSSEEWKTVKNLLEGNIMLIQSKSKDDMSITLETIKNIFLNKKFSVRFILTNHNLYRKKDIENHIKNTIFEKSPSKVSLLFLESFKNNTILLQTLYKRTNILKESNLI